MPPSEHSGSSIPMGDGVLFVAMQAAAEKTDNSLPATLTSNRMLHILQKVAPEFYEAWAESRVEDVARALYESRRGVLDLVPMPGLAEAVGGWDDLTADDRAEWRADARAALGLGERT